jgi:hypothetical protein
MLPVILLAYANDRQGDVFLRGIVEEAKAVQQALQSATEAKKCQLEVLADVSADDIINAFNRFRDRVCIFHYAGHAADYGLLLSSKGGALESVHGNSLAEFLRTQKGLELVFLNGCSSQGNAQALLGANVKNVIATSRAINDEAARDFAAKFYAAFASGATVGVAYDEAKQAVLMKHNGNSRSLIFEEMPDVDADEKATPWNLFGTPSTKKLTDFNMTDQVRALIAKGKTEEALKLLLASLPEGDTKNMATNLSAKHTKAKRNEMMGMASSSETAQQYAQVNFALLELLGEQSE